MALTALHSSTLPAILLTRHSSRSYSQSFSLLLISVCQSSHSFPLSLTVLLPVMALTFPLLARTHRHSSHSPFLSLSSLTLSLSFLLVPVILLAPSFPPCHCPRSTSLSLSSLFLSSHSYQSSFLLFSSCLLPLILLTLPSCHSPSSFLLSAILLIPPPCHSPHSSTLPLCSFLLPVIPLIPLS